MRIYSLVLSLPAYLKFVIRVLSMPHNVTLLYVSKLQKVTKVFRICLLRIIKEEDGEIYVLVEKCGFDESKM